MPFIDRTDAGQQLAKALARYKAQRPVVLALPRGGVPVAAEVATALDAPLDLILVRKIGVPFQPELAMGAVVDGVKPVIVRNEEVIQLSGVTETDFNAIRDEQLAEIERRRKLYLGAGATNRAALHAIRMRKPSKLVLAVPVAPTDTLKELRDEADDIVCLEDYEEFGAIGLFYSDFRQVSDTEVIAILARHPVKLPTAVD